MIVLYILLWTLAAMAALLALAILLLCVSAGVRITNKTRDEKTKVVARYGILRLKVLPGKPVSPEKAAKKANKKAAKQEKKARKASQKRLKAASKRGKKGPVKKSVSLLVNLRSFIASFFDYDTEYLKLVYFKKLYILYAVGGDDSADIGRRFSRVCQAVGVLYPIAMRVLNIKKHCIITAPDFVRRKNVFKFDAVVMVRPIRVLYAAYKLWRANDRNRKIYGDNHQQIKQDTIKSRV